MTDDKAFEGWWENTGGGAPEEKIACRQAWHVAVKHERERCAGVADNEPELPGDMPDEMWNAIRNDRDAMREALVTVVRLTKKNIIAAIRGGGDNS